MNLPNEISKITAFFHRKFKPKEGETIDLSQYIHEPVILKGWEIKQKVIPRVGYQHDDMTGYSSSATNVEASGTETGPAGDYYQTSIASRSPFYYGGHGEAAVYYDGETEIGPFRELFVNDETIDVTIPIPADGPSFGVAPSGTWMCTSCCS